MTHLLHLLLIWIAAITTPVPSQSDTFPLQFPIPPATDDQVVEAIICQLDPESAAQLGAEPSACELANAALALANARGDDDPLSEEEIQHFVRMITANPALPQRLDLIATYFNQVSLVAPPDFADQAVVALDIQYAFSGIGNTVDYHIRIEEADTAPVVSGEIENNDDYASADTTPTPIPLPETVDSALVQAFGPALSDLMPIDTKFQIINCFDYYPDWTVDLTFADGTTIEMVTNGTNIVGIGGPWQTEIDSQVYMQYSGAFPTAIIDLFDALGLPFGQTAAMTCGGIDDPINDLFPRDVVTSVG